MNEINITNSTNETIDEKLLYKVANYALEYEKVSNAVLNIIRLIGNIGV